MIKQKNIIAVLDIGSSKIMCMIAKINAQKQIEVLGGGHCASKGFKAGVITDVDLAKDSVIHAVEKAEKITGETIKNVYVSLNSNNLISENVQAEITVSGHEINMKDLNKLLIKAISSFNQQEVEIIHSFATEYILDGNRGITSPLGLYGNKLLCRYHIVIVPSIVLFNITNCLAKCQLGVINYISSAYASGLSCLTADEIKLGAVLIEFGGGMTSISIFGNNNLLFTDGLPFGGISITNDIAKCLGIDFFSAEKVKILHGRVNNGSFDDNEIIEISANNEENTESIIITKAELTEIIKARVEEIITLIMKKFQHSKLKNFSNKIVICGGSIQLYGSKKLISELFNMQSRVGNLIKIKGITEEEKDISFSTAIGMLIHVAELISRDKKNISTENSNKLAKLWQWIKENF